MEAVSTKQVSWPVKQREMHTNHFDSTVWNDFQFRDDDIIISTYLKSGTTWVQQIVSQLVFMGAEDIPVAELSPWMDLRIPPAPVKHQMVEAQLHRRFLKTHLPVDALVFSPKAKYIYVGRDGRDVLWSSYNHHVKANEKWYDALNNSPGLVGPPIDKPNPDVRAYYHKWLDENGYPWWSAWDNWKSWWEIRNLPNVHLTHFAKLKQDMPAEIRKIAAFLDIEIDESKWDDIVEHCSFDYMKSHSEATVPLGGIFWDGGAKSFIHKGTNGRWKDVLSEEESLKFERMAKEKLGNDCAHWLMTGEQV